MPGAGDLSHKVAFDPPLAISDGYGNEEQGWDLAQRVIVWAAIRYQRGGEAVQGGRRTGRGIYKLRLRQSASARAITTDWRLTDLQTGQTMDIIEVDELTDRSWIWIAAEAQTEVAL